MAIKRTIRPLFIGYFFLNYFDSKTDITLTKKSFISHV